MVQVTEVQVSVTKGGWHTIKAKTESLAHLEGDCLECESSSIEIEMEGWQLEKYKILDRLLA